MSERMASQRVAAEQDDVDGEYDRSEPDPEFLAACVYIEEPHRPVHIAGEDNEKGQRHVEEVAVDVLNHEWEEFFAAIARAGLAHGAVRRVGPEALVVRSPIAVSYTHLRAHETRHDLVCRLLLEKKKSVN